MSPNLVIVKFYQLYRMLYFGARRLRSNRWRLVAASVRDEWTTSGRREKEVRVGILRVTLDVSIQCQVSSTKYQVPLRLGMSGRREKDEVQSKKLSAVSN